MAPCGSHPNMQCIVVVKTDEFNAAPVDRRSLSLIFQKADHPTLSC